jgi:hypothetical protein
MFLRVSVVVLFLVFLSGCAVVTDKGKLSGVSKYDKNLCDEKVKAIVFVESDMSRTFWGKSETASYTYKSFQDKISKRFMASGCFSDIEITPLSMSNPPTDALYITLKRDAAYGGFPFENLIALALPMQSTSTIVIDAIVEFNQNKTAYSIEDYYKVGNWSLFILFYPFMDDPHQYIAEKNNDIIDALILSMKNDGLLKNIKVKRL